MLRIVLAFCILLLGACSSPEPSRDRVGKGGKVYGGVFNTNETEEIQGFFPHTLSQSASHRIAAQLFEGLVKFDQSDLSLVPALAESWTLDQTATEYTFVLRKDVHFHDDPCFPDGVGRAFAASDVVECFTALCSYGEMNQMFWLFQDRVLGADAHYAATSKGGKGPGVKGIEALDEHTLRITLTQAWPGFLQVLGHQGCWIYPQELVQKYSEDAKWHPVGTGPFRLKSFSVGKVMIMEREPNYWGRDSLGDQLPFLDGLKVTFDPDKNKELGEFEKGHLSAVYELPVERTDILEKGGSFQVQSIPGSSVQFYGLNMNVPPFNDPLVRRAFTMAIDRRLLVDSVLKGLAVPADHGVVPPGFDAYPYDKVPSTKYDPIAARALLAEAGFADGKGMPPVHLQVNNDGFGYVRVAGAVQSMLEKNLGVPVVSSVLPRDQHYGNVEMGKAQFWREGWVADHPDPENFLALFYGKNVPLDPSQPSYLNSTRYRNATFDSLYCAAIRNGYQVERMRLLAEAEAQLMQDAVVIPLYHERAVRLLQPWVRDMPINGMEYRDMRAVWFDPEARKK